MLTNASTGANATVSAVQPAAQRIESQGTEIRVVSVRPQDVYGVLKHWVDVSNQVVVSDIEKTIIDCLRRPDLYGGYQEVDVGAWMIRERINAGRLVEYALRSGVGAVIRRLGYLLDSCQSGTESDRNRLSAKLTSTYQLLDPTLPSEGPYVAKWRLRLNVGQKEIKVQRNT